MQILAILIPLLIIISAFVLYPFTGRRQFLHFDVVQFVYSFILMPIVYVWVKSFLFFVVKSDLGNHIGMNELFVIDTAFSVIFLFVYAFLVIHSLTKSFELQVTKDPLADIFELSEYFHLSLSHFGMYIGLLVILTILSFVNLVIPIPIDISGHFYLGLILGAILGLAVYMGTVQYENASRRFWRIMKLLYASTFIVHAVAYYLFLPAFRVSYGLFWLVLSMSLTLVFLAVFGEPLDDEKWLYVLPFSFNFKKGFHWVKRAKLAVANTIIKAETEVEAEVKSE